jgi:predicted phage terminase large subunit-like protein
MNAEEIRAEILAIDQELARRRAIELLEKDFATFFREAWRVVEPDTPLIWSWHYDLIAEWLTMVTTGEFKRRYPEKLGLIFNVPPRSAKSTKITVAWPVWSWLPRPGMRFVCASYARSLSADHSIKRRHLIESDWFQSKWASKFQLAGDRNTTDHYDNDKTGFHIATAVGAKQGTGFGGDVLLGDDLINAEEAFSEATIKATNRWIDSTWATRRNNPATGVFVHVCQRLAPEDPTGHLLEDGAGDWVHVKIPMEAEADERWEFPLSGRIVERKKGSALQPERNTPEVLGALKKKSLVWACQYQQEPGPSTGILFQPKWWSYFQKNTPLPSFDIVALSVDCTFKDLDSSDYVAIQKWGGIGARSYLLDSVMEKLDFVGTKAFIKSMVPAQKVGWHLQELPKATHVLIEGTANGPAVISALKAENYEGAVVIEITPDGGKMSRAYGAQGDAEAGNVYLPEDAPWLQRFIRVHKQFPAVINDDEVDAHTQFINWRRTNRHGVIEFYKSEAERLKREKEEAEMKRLGKVAEPSDLAKPATGVEQVACPRCRGIVLRDHGSKLFCVRCENLWDKPGQEFTK